LGWWLALVCVVFFFISSFLCRVSAFSGVIIHLALPSHYCTGRTTVCVSWFALGLLQLAT
jgi:hypothetical protein